MGAAAPPRPVAPSPRLESAKQPFAGLRPSLGHPHAPRALALTSLAAAGSIEEAVAPQQTALPVDPAVLPARAEIGQDGHLGPRFVTLPAAARNSTRAARLSPPRREAPAMAALPAADARPCSTSSAHKTHPLSWGQTSCRDKNQLLDSGYGTASMASAEDAVRFRR